MATDLAATADIDRTHSLTLGTREAKVFGIAVTVLAGVWFWNTTHQLNRALPIVCPGLAFTAMLWFGSGSVLERIEEWVRVKPLRIFVVPAALWVLYFAYIAGMQIADWRSALLMAIYLAVPFLGMSFTGKVEPFVILWLWLPLEFGILRNVLITRRTGADLHYAFAQLLVVDTGIIAFVVLNRTPSIGYRFEVSQRILSSGLVHFFLFAAIAIPLGLTIGFIRYNFMLWKLYSAPLVFIGIFLLTALPEEFLFRGLIQNWIERKTGRQTLSLVTASVIFGASHLNNGPPIPNYKYFLMATIAGLFYGRAWRNTGSLMASSMTHALVDTFWSVIFR